jgi:hypothetical protein
VKLTNYATAVLAALVIALALSAQDTYTPGKIQPGQMKALTWTKPSQLTPEELASMAKTQPTLPFWSYSLTSPRDGNTYTGVVVGNDPRKPSSGQAEIPAQIVPFIIVTNLIVTSINPDGSYNTVPGQTVFDPTVADSNCLTAPNDVPLTLTQQSPIFKSAHFIMGGTDVGTTQYGNAFQRANFWNIIKRNKYGVLLKPVTTLDPIVLNIPAASGVALPPDLLGVCGPIGEIDLFYLDALIDQQILPLLYLQGVNSTTLPIPLMYNTVMSFGTPTFFNCCVLGYHGSSGLQTYTPVRFDSTGAAGPADLDIEVLSHEIGEWINDPYGANYTPAWGHTGQVSGCQNNMEVGDPLSGTDLPLVTMPNGFSYHLQELAFFSWFFGGDSLGVNGWYSDNGTFLTDAGPVCQ